MPKLIKKSDGSIAFEYEEGSSERTILEKKMKLVEQVQSIKKKEFKSLSQSEKDTLLELLLRMHNLI